MEQHEQVFSLVVSENPDDPWVGVIGGLPKGIPYPFDLCLGRTEGGKLVCTGLRMGTGARFPLTEDVQVTAGSLRLIPLGEVLRFLTSYEASDDPWVKKAMGPLVASKAKPYTELTTMPGRRGHPDSFYREAAKQYLEVARENPQKIWPQLAHQRGYSDSQTRRQLQKAWTLFPELKPKEGA